MMTFRVAPDWYDDEDFADGAKTVTARDSREAAERYVVYNHHALDWPQEIRVRVLSVEGVSRFDVTVSQVPYCQARPVK